MKEDDNVKCVKCHAAEGTVPYSEGGMVCENCAADTFVCPDCGMTYPDYTYDAGNGFCQEHAPDH